MSKLSRRSVLRGSVGLAAAGTLGRPFIANAAAKTVSVWWTQGFVREEDVGFKRDGRGVREGERQHDRPQHHSVRAADAEDRLGADQRRRPGRDEPRHRRPIRSFRRMPGTTSWST